MAELIVTDDKEPYGIVEDSLSDPNDHANGFEAGNAGQYNDNSKSLDWQRGWADSHRSSATEWVRIGQGSRK
jgi:hypothetical protein